MSLQSLLTQILQLPAELKADLEAKARAGA